MTEEKKYTLLRAGKLMPNNGNDKKIRFYQLQALRDIPEHNVKAGDLGGFVTNKETLSHEGTCWIGGQAQTVGYVYVDNNAYIGDTAFLISNIERKSIYIEDNAKVYDNARIGYAIAYGAETVIKGNAKVHGTARLTGALEVADDVEIYGDALIEENVRVLGNSKIYGQARLFKNCRVIDTVVNGLAEVGEAERIRNGEPDTDGISSTAISSQAELNEVVKMQEHKIQQLEISLYEQQEQNNNSVTSPVREKNQDKENPETLEIMEFFEEINANIAAYTTDIVKIIKYPVMADPSVPETLAMTLALKKAVRLSKKPSDEKFHEAVEDLEQKFILAEANAFKLSSTLLSDEEKKKVRKASDLLRVASNDASSEQEKKVAFVQGFKHLEGVLVVPEAAVDSFRIKVGLKEIEA